MRIGLGTPVVSIRAGRMPPFFIPFAKDVAEAESVYQAIRNRVIGPLGDQRIFRIAYLRNGRRYRAEVGAPEQHEGGLVIAILKRHEYPLYYVCTADRGGERGDPILVGENEVITSEDFNPV
jgi:hypothetical protein